MKPVRDMSRLELAGFIAGAFKAKGISVVLSGGSCVSIYSGLEQAILVARANPIDLKEVERWSRSEGKSEAFSTIKKRLKVNGHS